MKTTSLRYNIILKIKAWVYRRTGIYLAHKEELEYITSKIFWNEFRKIVIVPENDLSLHDIQGLLIGYWQCNHGFARELKR